MTGREKHKQMVMRLMGESCAALHCVVVHYSFVEYGGMVFSEFVVNSL